MIDRSLVTKLYTKRTDCLHVSSYEIWDGSKMVCGPCFFRAGVIDEVPTRVNMREGSGLWGSPQIDPRTLSHIMLNMGLITPEPRETMKAFRRRRKKLSYPTPKLFPVSSALWELTGVQPPLATALIEFCKGYNEVCIADQLDLSIYNVQDRLRKAVNVGRKFLKDSYA